MPVEKIKSANLTIQNVTLTSRLKSIKSIQKVTADSGGDSFVSFTSKTNQPNSKPNKRHNVVFGSILAAAAVAGGILFAIKKQVTAKIKLEVLLPQNKLSDGLDAIREEFEIVLQKFPEDKKYYQKLAKGLNLKEGEEFKLASVMGKTRLQDFLDKSKPEDFQVGTNFANVENGFFKTNLHIHTASSDGKMSIEELLNQAAQYADKVNIKTKGKLTLAISDHDTLDGSRDALKIISNNPVKYKNLNLVPSAEVSFICNSGGEVTKPEPFEIMAYSINPFDNELNDFFKKLQTARKNTITSCIKEVSQKFKLSNFDRKEAVLFNKNLNHGTTTNVQWTVNNYLQVKHRICWITGEINNSIKDETKKLDSKVLYKKLTTAFDKSYKHSKNPHFFKEFLEKDEALNIIGNDFDKKWLRGLISSIPHENSEIKHLCTRTLPQMDKPLPLTEHSMDDVINAFKASRDGVLGLAHPAFIGDRHLNPTKLISDFKEKAEELGCAAELNYQSYPQRLFTHQSAQKETIENSCRAAGLKAAGGIDNHCNNIFCESEIKQKKIKELLEN